MMQRRTFMQACAALVAGAYVPTIQVNPQVKLESLLGSWVDRGEGLRYDLDLPFVVERYGFATDSRAAARIVLDEPDTDSPERRLPDMLGVWNTLDKPAGQWHRLPQKNLVRHRDGNGYCPVCLADGAIIDCPTCDGNGFVIHDDISCLPCPQCHGNEQISNGACQTCHGRPFGDYTYLQPFGDTLISELYASRLRKIPGEVLWCRSANRPPGYMGNSSPILFRSEIGIEGMIMPVTQR